MPLNPESYCSRQSIVMMNFGIVGTQPKPRYSCRALRGSRGAGSAEGFLAGFFRSAGWAGWGSKEFLGLSDSGNGVQSQEQHQ